MVDNEILEMLGDIGRSSTARMSPAVYLRGDNANLRRQEVLGVIRGTILPRRLEFTAADGSTLAIEVNSSRITDVFRCVSGPVPDFETEPRDELTDKLAKLMTDIATAPGPLELVSKRPDTTLEADDVGITYSEVEAACGQIDLPLEPRISVVPDSPLEAAPEIADASLPERFFDATDRFAFGQVLLDNDADDNSRFAGLCEPEQPAHPDQALLKAFLKDLAGWQSDSDTALADPQLIVMRPSGGQGAGIAVLRDGHQTSVALHDARKLGAVVSTWESLRDAVE